jgi:hypothetical protein
VQAQQLHIEVIGPAPEQPAPLKPFRRELVDRKLWLEAVEEETLAHRRRMSAKHELRAQLALQAGDEKVRLKPLAKQNAEHREDWFSRAVVQDLARRAEDFLYTKEPDERAQELSKLIDATALPARAGITAPGDDVICRRELGATLLPHEHGEREAAADRPLPYPREGEIKHPRGSVSGYHWHKTRAAGQLDRFSRVRRCGSERMKHFCACCAKPGPDIELNCDQHRLCIGCRQRRAHRYQKRFQIKQDSIIKELRKAGLRERTKVRPDGTLVRGGQWGEKFLTLTLPHSGDIAADVAQLPKAWRRFWRAVRTHIAKDVLAGETKGERAYLLRFVEFTRVIEVTEGIDGAGHAHLHVYFVAPYIDKYRLAHLWGEALDWSYKRALVAAGCVHPLDTAGCDAGGGAIQGVMQKAEANLERRGYGLWVRGKILDRERSWYVTRRGKHGRPLAILYNPVVDIREVVSHKPREGQIQRSAVAAELVKYLIKDCSHAEGFELLEPRVYARIYAALEGRRAIASSRGFLALIEKPGCYCRDCGSTWRRWIELPKMGESPRGPPDQLTLSIGV